ncbi:MAG TPA: winged helix-turn-helix domain-containing protein [Vicinamibacterales bacterium]|nr:winged helix-turn-helix domain-containing protein [Vicinamibacterales bacterium]
MTDPRAYRFGDVDVDLSRMSVKRGGLAVDLEPKVFDVLRFLIERRDRLVTKDELLENVWPGTFVAPNALTRAVAQLRKALGDDADRPRYIETIAKRGYRFIAPVVIDGGGVPEVVPAPVPATPSRRLSSVAIIGLAVASILVVGLTVWIVRRTQPRDGVAGALTPVRVSTTGGINVEPALSPDGSAVAFASDRSGSFEIYVVSLARGSKEIAITSDGMNNIQPAWSPDGRWITYARSNGRGVWIVPSTGGSPRELVESGSHPVWSPDSNWIAFTTQTGLVGQSNLKVVGRDGSGLRELTHPGDPVGGHRSPSWSHSGRFIAFATVRGADEASVWIVDAAGGTPRRLRTALGADNVQFSEDDRALFFNGNGNILYRLAIDPVQGTSIEQTPEVVLSLPGEFDGISMSRDGLMAYGLATTDTNLWTVDFAPGGEVREPARLTDDSVGRTTRPDYSPDGRRLTYSQGASRYEAIPWVMNADGSGRSQLITEGGGAGNLSWAPDGERVLVQRDTADGRTMFWLDLSTRRLTPLDLVKNARNPRLSPDGREIAYWMIEANGSTNTWIQALDHTHPRRLTDDAESINYPAWSPDGQWLAVQIKRDKDTYVGVVSKNGGPVDQITHDKGLSGVNSWSPDGDQIAFAGQRDGVWNVWAVSRRTRVSRQLTHFTAPSDYVLYPSWSPDGHRIAFERGIRRGNVWTVQVN